MIVLKNNIYYRLKIDVEIGKKKESFTFTDLQIDFNINKTINVFNFINSFNATIYNLNDENRLFLEKSRLNYIYLENMKREYIEFYAGYEKSNLPLLFKGEIETCQSWRENNIIKTEIKAHELYFPNDENDTIQLSYMSSTPNYLTRLLKEFKKKYSNIGTIYASPKAELEYFKSIPNHKSPMQYYGNALDILKSLDIDENNKKKYRFMILDTNISITLYNEKGLVKEQLKTISNEIGLLDSPRIEGNFLEVKMLFEPSLKINEFIRFDFFRKENKKYNFTKGKLEETRRVYSINHNCKVAGNHPDGYKYGTDGKCITTAKFDVLFDIEILDKYSFD